MIYLITGGSGSGKSAYAEKVIDKMKRENRIYLATMYPYDQESYKRIDRHQSMRQGKGFDTWECYTGFEKLEIPPESQVLLECVSNLVANERYLAEGAGEYTVQAVVNGIRKLANQAENLVIVTNEICGELWPYSEETENYRQDMGQINIHLAQMADQVIEVVYGIPIFIKGETNSESVVE